MISLIILILLSITYISLYLISKKSEPSKKSERITKGIKKILLIAPIIAIIIFTILFLTVLKGRIIERSSHALIVFTLWLYATSFYVSILKYFKNKKILLISIIAMIIFIAFAIYLTPLDRYTKDLYQFIHQAVYAIGIIMLCLFYYTNIKEI